MPRVKKKAAAASQSAATVGYEAQLLQMADALRGRMDAAEYKHVCLGLLFLKYISDAFEEKHAALLAEKAQGADLEDPDEYSAQSIFWVPPEARWPHLKAQARQSTIGQLVDHTMAGIERDNPALKGVLPKDYARPALDKQRLGQLIDMISNIKVGDEASRAKDVLGRVYEYFLSQFATADAKAYISIYDQESNYTAWRLTRMNLAIRDIDSGQNAQRDTFPNDRHPDLKADFIVASPPFNISAWGGKRLRDDKHWQYAVPSADSPSSPSSQADSRSVA